MKRLFCLLVSGFIVGASYGQRPVDITPASPIPVDSSTYTPLFREVVQTGSASKEQVIAQARTWVAKAFPNANDVIQQYDAAQGILVVKGMTTVQYVEHQPSFNVKTNELSNIYYTLTVESKAGRSRITIDKIEFKDQDEIVQGRDNAPAVYVARIRPNAVELEQRERQLDEMPLIGPKMAKKLAPLYLTSDRNKDRAMFERMTSILADVKSVILAKDKDW